MKKYLWLALIVFIVVIGVIGILYTRKSEKPAVNGQFYSCLYVEGNTHARCISKGNSENPGGCYGYYDLKTDKISDGIKITDAVQSTCEGNVLGAPYYFDKFGSRVE